MTAMLLTLTLLPAADRPNILLLVTDDQRADTLSCAGHPVLQTPHIDALAAGGVRFTNAFVTTAICAISRASILTGQHARAHGITGFATMLDDRQWADSFPARLRAAGYHTGFVGKWGVGQAKDMPVDAYDVWHGYPGQGRYFEPGRELHMTDHLTGQALSFLAEAPADRPFCLHVSFKAPHCQDRARRQFPPAERYESLFADVTVQPGELVGEADFARLPPFLQTSMARERWGFRFATPELYQQSVKDYWRLIAGVDDAVGRMVAALEADGRLADTVVLFTSDHGFYLGERGLAGKWFMHEESIRVPFIVRDPRLPASRQGVTDDRMVLNIDVAPTLCDLAGAAAPAAMQGASVMPLVRGESPAWRSDFYYQHPFDNATIPVSEGVRGERFKYVRYPDRQPPYEELFDLQADPLERHDLAADPESADVLERLRDRWRILRGQAADAGRQ